MEAAIIFGVGVIRRENAVPQGLRKTGMTEV